MRAQPASSEISQTGRRVLVAVVTGEVGARVQAWRERYDPEQARRLPPHATLCYWPPTVEPEVLERQVRHAFDRPISVRLGGVHEFGNKDHTFYVEVLETVDLDAARARLYDGTYLELPRRPDWTWHVTCVRYGKDGDLLDLRRAASDLTLDALWQVDTVAYLELRGDRYETVAEWRV
jgi:2'-5' RNA ligase